MTRRRLPSPRRAVTALLALTATSLLTVVGTQGGETTRASAQTTGAATGFSGPSRYEPLAPTEADAAAQLHQPIGTQGGETTRASAQTTGAATGFSVPFSGPSRYEPLAPTEADAAAQLHQPIGQQTADALAVSLGLKKSNSLTEQQYLEFITGQGVGGDPVAAALVDESVRILTNTVGRPLYSVVNGVLTPTVLASYGLFVTRDGWLESPAYKTAPTRLVNTVIAPGGYMGRWMRANGATASLIGLYRSAYFIEAAFGFVAQQISGKAQLVTNTKGMTSVEVGMSMAPALWLTNFTLIYTLNPTLAGYLPRWWAPIPSTVSDAILASPTGRVRYADYASDLH